MDKIVRNTPAGRDQEHIKLVVEQNPQIPDRTKNLIGDGIDPTIALYSTCKRLEADEADIIAIPCNTAHAFVERIQPYLSIPIVNMLFETAECIRREHRSCKRIGLLATSGTIGSRVYHDAIADAAKARAMRFAKCCEPQSLSECIASHVYLAFIQHLKTHTSACGSALRLRLRGGRLLMQPPGQFHAEIAPQPRQSSAVK